MICCNFVSNMNKDTYIWFSTSGQMFNCFKSEWIHNDGVAVHNQWATGYIAEKIIGCEDWEFDVVMKFVKENECEYILKKSGGFVTFLGLVIFRHRIKPNIQPIFVGR